jgi:hypothetical protein
MEGKAEITARPNSAIVHPGGTVNLTRNRHDEGRHGAARPVPADIENVYQKVDLARWLRRNVDGRPFSLRKVAAELAEYGGYRGPGGVPYAAAAVASMLGE